MTYPSNSLHTPGTPPSRGGDFVGELNAAIRQNPVPAALIGAGVLWLFMGGAKNTSLGGTSLSVLSGIGQGARHAGSAAYRGAEEVGGSVAAGVSRIAETAGELGSQAAGALRNATGAVASTANETAGQVTEAAKAVYDATGSLVSSTGVRGSQTPSGGSQSLRSNGFEMSKGFQVLVDIFAQQPLLLGVVGLAVGAGIAASLPRSDKENRLMGGTADAVKDQAQELWTTTTKRVEAMASRGLDEAKSQGLTPKVAAEGLRSATDKVTGLAERATDRVASRLSGEVDRLRK